VRIGPPYKIWEIKEMAHSVEEFKDQSPTPMEEPEYFRYQQAG
jgi:hypothetical protein